MVLLVDQWEQKVEMVMNECSIRISIVIDVFLADLGSSCFRLKPPF